MGFRGQYKNKRDANEKKIVAAIRAAGFSVIHMDQPADLLCGFRGCDYLVEVKMPDATLTTPQEIFYGGWRGSKTILLSVEDALQWTAKIKGRFEVPMDRFVADGQVVK